jgi:hypothetical protein
VPPSKYIKNIEKEVKGLQYKKKSNANIINQTIPKSRKNEKNHCISMKSRIKSFKFYYVSIQNP